MFPGASTGRERGVHHCLHVCRRRAMQRHSLLNGAAPQRGNNVENAAAFSAVKIVSRGISPRGSSVTYLRQKLW